MASAAFSFALLRSELRKLYLAERSDFYRIIAFGVIQAVLALIVPIAVGNLINAVSFGGLLQPVVILTVIVLAFLIAGAVVRLLQIWFIEILQRRLFARVALHASEAAADTEAEKDELFYRSFFTAKESDCAAYRRFDGAHRGDYWHAGHFSLSSLFSAV
ncbi:MAG: hypothetical protein U1F16_04375 [Turneriella sp.]